MRSGGLENASPLGTPGRDGTTFAPIRPDVQRRFCLDAPCGGQPAPAPDPALCYPFPVKVYFIHVYKRRWEFYPADDSAGIEAMDVDEDQAELID